MSGPDRGRLISFPFPDSAKARKRDGYELRGIGTLERWKHAGDEPVTQSNSGGRPASIQKNPHGPVDRYRRCLSWCLVRIGLEKSSGWRVAAVCSVGPGGHPVRG